MTGQTDGNSSAFRCLDVHDKVYTEREINMRLLYQFGVILTITFLGEALHAVIPLPIPASIYGLVLMLLALCTKTVKLRQVKVAADFLLDIMPPMFIPAAVGLVVVWDDLREMLIPVLVIVTVTTVAVMAVTGRTAQSVIRRKKRKEAGE